MDKPLVTHQAALHVPSLAELRKVENEICRRLKANSLASQLFLLDPLRALADVGVVLAKEAIQEWDSAVPGVFKRDGGRAATYARIQAVGGLPSLRVTIHGLAPPPGTNLQNEDDEVARELIGYASLSPDRRGST